LIVLFKKLKQRVLKKIFSCLWEFDCPLQEIEANSLKKILLCLWEFDCPLQAQAQRCSSKEFEENSLVLMGI